MNDISGGCEVARLIVSLAGSGSSSRPCLSAQQLVETPDALDNSARPVFRLISAWLDTRPTPLKPIRHHSRDEYSQLFTVVCHSM